MVDANGVEVGLFQHPMTAAMLINGETVMATIDLQTHRLFEAFPPFYYASGDCSGPAMLYASFLRVGTAFQGTLYYPRGAAVATDYQSYSEDGFCTFAPGNATLAQVGTLPLSNYAAPFRLVR